MSQLQITARMKIKPGQLERFKEIAAACLESVIEKDTGTLQYDWFLSEDGTVCDVREVYRDSDALLQHSMNLGALMGEILEVSEFSAEIYGSPSDKLREALQNMDVGYFSYLQGL